MSTELHDHPEASIGSLMGGIVDDFRDLVRQELLLAREQIAEDLRKTREASLVWGLGIGAFFLGGFSFCLMLANLLHSVTSHGNTDPAAIPMWACYGIVGFLLTIGGVVGVVAGQKRFDSIHLVDNQIDKAVKEISND
jgi:hypothetical protein